MFYFYTSWGYQKTSGFVMFSESVEVEHWLMLLTNRKKRLQEESLHLPTFLSIYVWETFNRNLLNMLYVLSWNMIGNK